MLLCVIISLWRLIPLIEYNVTKVFIDYIFCLSTNIFLGNITHDDTEMSHFVHRELVIK